MELKKVLFNRNPLVYGSSMEQPQELELKNTFSLWNASYEDAIRYGGEITRSALSAIKLHGDRKNVIVDTKIHMLMAGFSPAILGWHQDGSPRDNLKNPQGSGLPDVYAQEGDERFNRYHIIVTGTGCLTKFIKDPMYVNIPASPSYDTYKMMSSEVNEMYKKDPSIAVDIPSCTAVEFDWWSIHTGVIATKKEWRFLIRVCESDYYEPQKDLRQVIRMQSQVYCPENFGW